MARSGERRDGSGELRAKNVDRKAELFDRTICVIFV